jgi:hypothetical protein
MNLYDEFKWRGMVYDATDGLVDVFARERVTAYIGFDPTASSLVAEVLPQKALHAGKAGSSGLIPLSARFTHRVSQANGDEVLKADCNLPEILPRGSGRRTPARQHPPARLQHAVGVSPVHSQRQDGRLPWPVACLKRVGMFNRLEVA